MTNEKPVKKNAVEQKNDSRPGVVKVHESVLASITRKAVMSVPDVLRLSGSSFIDNIAEMVGSRKTFDRAIVIEMGEDSVAVEVRIVVRYGAFIPQVASAVRNAVVAQIVGMTGMKISRVNVVVMDLDEEAASAEAE